MMRDIEEIKEELRTAEALLVEKLKRERDAVIPEWRYIILPKQDKYIEVYDDTCLVYYLHGDVVNKEALKKVGAHINAGGGMNYIFNTGTGKLVTSFGGGTMYIGRVWGDSDNSSSVRAMSELSAFLVEHPEGGNVTSILEAHRKRKEVMTQERKARRDSSLRGV